MDVLRVSKENFISFTTEVLIKFSLIVNRLLEWLITFCGIAAAGADADLGDAGADAGDANADLGDADLAANADLADSGDDLGDADADTNADLTADANADLGDADLAANADLADSDSDSALTGGAPPCISRESEPVPPYVRVCLLVENSILLVVEDDATDSGSCGGGFRDIGSCDFDCSPREPNLEIYM